MAQFRLIPLALDHQFQSVQISLQRFSTLKQIITPAQLGVTYKVTEGVLNTLLQSVRY